VHLSDLSETKNRDNSTTDGWDRDIKYEVTGTTIVTLSSFGADGLPGGTGLNLDIISAFDISKDR